MSGKERHGIPWPPLIYLAAIVALVLAFATDRIAFGRGAYRTALLVPYAIAPAIAGGMWAFLFNPIAGPVAALMKLAGIMGSLTERLTGRPGKLNYTSAYLLCLDNYYSGKKAERELQVRYKPIEDAVSSAISWFEENNYF